MWGAAIFGQTGQRLGSWSPDNCGARSRLLPATGNPQVPFAPALLCLRPAELGPNPRIPLWTHGSVRHAGSVLAGTRLVVWQSDGDLSSGNGVRQRSPSVPRVHPLDSVASRCDGRSGGAQRRATRVGASRKKLRRVCPRARPVARGVAGRHPNPWRLEARKLPDLTGTDPFAGGGLGVRFVGRFHLGREFTLAVLLQSLGKLAVDRKSTR